MFSTLPESERMAFYGLLDEYFESRPHLLPSQASTSDPNTSSISSESVTLSRNDVERAGRFANSPLGQKMVGHALGSSGRGVPPEPPASSSSSYGASTSKKGPPPAPPGRKLFGGSSPPVEEERRGPGGVKIPAGLSTGRSMGSIKTGSKGEAFSSFIHKPRGAKAEAIKEAQVNEPILPPARNNKPAPPPIRRGGSVSNPAPPQAVPGEPMGEALYAYEGTDSDDFTCSEGERFYLVERVSDDWWKAKSLGGGREGLVPSNYVQAL